MSDEISELKEAEKAYDEDERGAFSGGRRKNNNWVAGVVLIAIGLIFLLSNVTNFHLDNWWALFILIPAVSNFGNAWNKFREHGTLSRSVRGSLTSGLIITLVASIFLFNLDWGLFWPVIIIIIGVSALLGGWFD